MRTIITIIITLTAVACNDSTTTNNVNNTNNTEICNDNIDNDFDGDIDCNDFDCRYTTSCTVGACGNGAIEGDEECDGGNFDGKSCITEGYTSGQLSCNADCTIDVEGCENPDPLKIMQSGGRIKMRVGRAAAPDGSVSFNGWYDTQLGINCVWRKAVDGAMRCLPELTAKKMYSDDECTLSSLVGVSPYDSSLSLNTLVSVYSGNGKYTVARTTNPYAGVAYVRDYSGICAGVARGEEPGLYVVEDYQASAFQEQFETIE